MGISQQIGASSLSKPGVCTSSTRPATPYEGQMIYETDTDKVLIYNGTAWVIPNAPAQNPTGLEFISSTTVGTTVTSVEVLSAFSATYDAYKIVATGVTASGAESVGMTLGNSGGYTSSGYDSGMIFNGAGVSTIANGNASSWNFVGSYATTTGMPLNIDVYSPFQSSPTAFSSIYARADNYGTPTGTLTGTTSYDRFSLQIIGGGTVTGGKIRVYGYRNS